MTGTITVAAATGSGPTPPPTSTQPLAPPSGSGDASQALLALVAFAGLLGAFIAIRRRARVG
jgi:hypothetical protein